MLDVRAVVHVLGCAGLEPRVEDLLEHRRRGRAQRQREHVGVVPLARAGGGGGVAAQRGADAADLVRGDRRAGAGPAAHDALLGAAVGDVARGGLGRPRPVVAVLGERAVQQRLVPAPPQLLDHGVGDPGALVGGDGDLHTTQGIVSRVVEESALEQELFAVGEKLAAALPRASRNPLKAADEKAMELASKDQELKAALFRFVDVVPACRNLDDLARHLTGFLGEVDEPPPPISAAMKMGAQPGRADGARCRRRSRRQAHGPPLHRRRVAARGARRVPRPVEGRRRLLRRPARRGDGDAGRGAALRGALRRSARDARGVDALVARPPAPRDRLVRQAPAREPERQGLRAHAADEARRPAARPARRGPAAPRPAAPCARARRAPAHRHGVAGLARRRARADPVAAGGGGVPGGTVGGRGPPGLPARLARHAGHDRASGSAERARSARTR